MKINKDLIISDTNYTLESVTKPFNIAEIYMGNNQHYNYTKGSEQIAKLPSTYVVGDRLSPGGNRITVSGDDVKGVLIAATSRIQTSTGTTTGGWICISKNGTKITSRQTIPNVSQQYASPSASIAMTYIPCKKGDYFELRYTINGSDGTYGVYAETYCCALTAIAIY